MLKTVRLIIIFTLLSVSCSTGDNKSQQEVTKYFDIKGLVREQMVILPATSLNLLKTAFVDKDTAQSIIKPDSSDWAREFQILLEADINKPRLANSYKKTIVNNPGPITIIKYVSLEPDKTHVDTLIISQHPSALFIHARMSSTNALFTASKTLGYHFKQKSGKLLLSDYTIKGWQKMIALDSVHYNIHATVNN
jgi:hypothetical protein